MVLEEGIASDFGLLSTCVSWARLTIMLPFVKDGMFDPVFGGTRAEGMVVFDDDVRLTRFFERTPLRLPEESGSNLMVKEVEQIQISLGIVPDRLERRYLLVLSSRIGTQQ